MIAYQHERAHFIFALWSVPYRAGTSGTLLSISGLPVHIREYGTFRPRAGVGRARRNPLLLLRLFGLFLLRYDARALF